MSMASSTQDLGERSSAWLRAAREGDRNALEQLVENQRADLLSIAANQLDSDLRVKESPSDLVQKSLLEGIQSFNRFRGASVADFGNYMRAILRNNVQDVRRRYVFTDKRALAREQEGVDPDAQPDTLSNSPSQFLQRRDEAAALRAKLSTLTGEQQRVLSLRFWEQMTFDEMAEVLGQKTDTVRKAYYRALAALTHAVENTGSHAE